MITKILSFVQANDKVFQLLAIAIPGLYFTYSYNEWQQYSKQIELSNLLINSLTTSQNETQRRVAFNLMAALPNRYIARQALGGLPLDAKIDITKPLLVDAIRTGDAQTINDLDTVLCDLVPAIDRSNPRFVRHDVGQNGYLSQLLSLSEPKRTDKLRIGFWLIRCGAVLFAKDELPEPPSLGDGDEVKTEELKGDLLAEALFSNEGRDVQPLLKVYLAARGTKMSELGSALGKGNYEWLLMRTGQLKALLVFMTLLEQQDPPTCNRLVETIAHGDHFLFESGRSHVDPKDWKAVFLRIKNGRLADCPKSLDPKLATVFAARSAKLLNE